MKHILCAFSSTWHLVHTESIIVINITKQFSKILVNSSSRWSFSFPQMSVSTSSLLHENKWYRLSSASKNHISMGQTINTKTSRKEWSTKEIEDVSYYLLFIWENLTPFFHLRYILTFMECYCFRLYAYPAFYMGGLKGIIISPLTETPKLGDVKSKNLQSPTGSKRQSQVRAASLLTYALTTPQASIQVPFN